MKRNMSDDHHFHRCQHN